VDKDGLLRDLSAHVSGYSDRRPVPHNWPPARPGYRSLAPGTGNPGWEPVSGKWKIHLNRPAYAADIMQRKPEHDPDEANIFNKWTSAIVGTPHDNIRSLDTPRKTDWEVDWAW